MGRAFVEKKPSLHLKETLVTANARPTGLLHIYHSETPKKYDKALGHVFRFLKK
jgi:hypothetical protein